MSLADEIRELKTRRNAVILAHYYVRPEVQDIADYVGDSFYLAKVASQLKCDTIVFCGVRFMGESAKLLNPGKRVFMPDMNADCPMAHMVEKSFVDDVRARYGSDVAVVSYVNSTAEVKAWSDVCVTSSNALSIVGQLPQRNILFIPDRNLGAYLAKQLPEKNFILAQGYCPVHEHIMASDVRALKERHPSAVVLAHPECNAEVRALANLLGSTSKIIHEAATNSDANTFIVATAVGVEHQMEKKAIGNRLFLFPEHPPVCPDMRMVTLEKVRDCLKRQTGEVTVDSSLADRARIPLAKMLEMGK